MFGRKGQVATEYILITGFVLIAVTIIFTYSYVSNNQNIKITQANNAVDKLVNKADLIYALGPDNNQFVEVTFPRDVQRIQDIVVCDDGHQEHYGFGQEACVGHGDVSFGAIELEVSLLGGISSISRPAKGEIELEIYKNGGLDPDSIPDATGNTEDGTYIIKVYWCGEKICLVRA